MNEFKKENLPLVEYPHQCRTSDMLLEQLKTKDKRVAELEGRLVDVRDYVNNSALIPPELRREIEVIINVILPEGGADG